MTNILDFNTEDSFHIITHEIITLLEFKLLEYNMIEVEIATTPHGTDDTFYDTEGMEYGFLWKSFLDEETGETDDTLIKEALVIHASTTLRDNFYEKMLRINEDVDNNTIVAKAKTFKDGNVVRLTITGSNNKIWEWELS